jgi:hypothetical protein
VSLLWRKKVTAQYTAQPIRTIVHIGMVIGYGSATGIRSSGIISMYVFFTYGIELLIAAGRCKYLFSSFMHQAL